MGKWKERRKKKKEERQKKRQERKEKRAERKKERKEKRKGFLKKMGRIIRRVNPVALPLLPYRVLMEKKVKEKGETPKEGIIELAMQFKRLYVSNYEENFTRNIMHYDDEFENFTRNIMHYDEGEHLDPATISTLISQILPILKNMFKKLKESNNPEDKKLADEIEDTAKDIVEASKEIEKEKKGGTSTAFDFKKLLIPIIAVAVGAVLFKKLINK